MSQKIALFLLCQFLSFLFSHVKSLVYGDSLNSTSFYCRRHPWMCQTEWEGKPFMVAAVIESSPLNTMYWSAETAHLEMMEQDKGFCLCKHANMTAFSHEKHYKYHLLCSLGERIVSSSLIRFQLKLIFAQTISSVSFVFCHSNSNPLAQPKLYGLTASARGQAHRILDLLH